MDICFTVTLPYLFILTHDSYISISTLISYPNPDTRIGIYARSIAALSIWLPQNTLPFLFSKFPTLS